MREAFLIVFLLGETRVSDGIGNWHGQLAYGETNRWTGKWVTVFNKDKIVQSGMDVNHQKPDHLAPTYVCRTYVSEISARDYSDLIVGAYQPEAGCCSIPFRAGQACMKEGDGMHVEFLGLPTAKEALEPHWVASMNGTIDSQTHDGIIIGGIYYFTPMLVCRFGYVNAAGQALTLQGCIGVSYEECRAAIGFRESSHNVSVQWKYELLVFTASS